MDQNLFASFFPPSALQKWDMWNPNRVAVIEIPKGTSIFPVFYHLSDALREAKMDLSHVKTRLDWRLVLLHVYLVFGNLHTIDLTKPGLVYDLWDNPTRNTKLLASTDELDTNSMQGRVYCGFVFDSSSVRYVR